MSKKEIEKYGEEMLKKSNVVGYAKTLQFRIRKGKTVKTEMCLQIHVTKKFPEKELRKTDLIPKTVGDIPVDVVEYGEPKALAKMRALSKPKIKKKTEKHRPLIHGISVGSTSISAGSNGYLMVDSHGEVFEGTDAHVVVDDVRLDPEDVTVRKITQPGPYDLPEGANIEDYVAGFYHWHKRLYPVGGDLSNCPVGNAWAKIYNMCAEFFKAETRLKPVVEHVNRIDFGVWKPSVEYTDKFFDAELHPDIFTGFGFAGSDKVSLICKAPYIVEEGYKPYRKPYAKTVEVGTIISKSGRTSCLTHATLILQSAVEIVNYGNCYIKFDDVYVTDGPLLTSGDSGSSCWIKEG